MSKNVEQEVDPEEAAFDALIAAQGDEYHPDDNDLLELKRLKLKAAINSRHAEIEDYRLWKQVGDANHMERVKKLIKGWTRAIDELACEVKDLEYKMGVHSREFSVSHSLPGNGRATAP